MIKPHTVLKKIYGKSTKTKIKRYILSVEDNDVLLYDDVTNTIVYRAIADKKINTKGYLYKKYGKSNVIEVTRTIMANFVVIPDINNTLITASKENKESVKIVPNVIKKTNKMLDTKVDAIKYCDKYDVRDTNNVRLVPRFKKIDDDTLEIEIGEKEFGGVNTIKCKFTQYTERYRHYFEGKFLGATLNLEDIFR